MFPTTIFFEKILKESVVFENSVSLKKIKGFIGYVNVIAENM